jgi:hypothetical protein
MNNTTKYTVPLEHATKEELIAAIDSTFGDVRASIESDIWSIRTLSLSRKIYLLVEEMESYKQPRDVLTVKKWQACNYKIDILQKQLDQLLSTKPLLANVEKVVQSTEERKAKAKARIELAREKFKRVLFREVTMDLLVCKMEGWDGTEYISELKSTIDKTAEEIQNHE